MCWNEQTRRAETSDTCYVAGGKAEADKRTGGQRSRATSSEAALSTAACGLISCGRPTKRLNRLRQEQPALDNVTPEITGALRANYRCQLRLKRPFYQSYPYVPGRVVRMNKRNTTTPKSVTNTSNRFLCVEQDIQYTGLFNMFFSYAIFRTSR